MREKDITKTLHLVKTTKGMGRQTELSDSRKLEELSVVDLFAKALRQKFLIAFTVLIVFIFAAVAFTYKGVWYSRSNIAQFNNFENNALFFIMDSLVPDDGQTRRWDNKQEYASRAVSAINSDDFLKALYDYAKSDKKLSSLLFAQGIDVSKEMSPDLLDRLREFFDDSVKISAPQGGGGILKLQTTGYFQADFKGASREFVDEFSNHLSRLMGQYLSKRELEDVQATRQLVSERLDGFKKEINELNEKRARLIASTPQWSPEAYNSLSIELERAKASLSGNKVVLARLGGLFQEMEAKVKALNQGAIQDEIAEDLDRELQRTLAHLRTVVKANSISEFEDSGNQNRASVENKYDPKLVDVYYMKQQFVYAEARVKTLEKTLTEIRDQINRRYEINNEIENISKSVAAKQKLTDSLELSKVRLDFADFKTLRRVEVFTGAIKKQTIMPIGAFALITIFLATILGIGVAFTAETKNPSLTTTRVFEELDVPVLGAIPSTKDFLIGDAIAFGTKDPRVMSYVRLAINLSNLMTYMKSKLALFTAADTPEQSATALYNLSVYYANTGRKVLMIEADFENQFLNKLLGTNADGGLSGILSYSKEVDIRPVKIQENLHLLSGDAMTLPGIYRLASEGFLELLEQLKQEYDYVFIHARPCLESPDAADLSRYVGVVSVCADAKSMRLSQLDRITEEMKLFLSKYSYLIVENALDDRSKYVSKSSKNKTSRRNIVGGGPTSEPLRKAS